MQQLNPEKSWLRHLNYFLDNNCFCVRVNLNRTQGLTNDTVNLNPTSAENSGDKLRHCGNHCEVKVYVCE